MPLNKPALEALNQTNFPDNQQQLITPVLLREFNDEMINSMELTQSMDSYANLGTANLFYGGNQSIAKEYKLFTNGVYWNNNTAGYNNLEIINSITGNIDIAALGGGVRIVSSSLNITNGTFTASLAEGFTYVGNSSGRSVLVATSSFGSVTSAITASSLITASFSGNTLTFTKGDASTFGVVIPDVSGSTINTGSFATTGSNTFNGSQTISGSVAVKNTLSFPNGLAFLGNAGDVSQISAATTIQLITEMPAGPGGTNDIKFINRVTGSSVSFINEREGAGNNVYFEAGEVIFNAGIRSGSNGNITFRNTINSIDASSTPITASAFKAGAGGINSAGALTASLQQGYAWVGNSSGVSTLVATSSFGSTINTGSFATTGSNTFVGNQTITSAGNTQINIESTGGPGSQQTNLDFRGNNSNFNAYGDFNIINNGQFGGSGSIKIIATKNNLSIATDDGFKVGATNGGGNGIDNGNISMQVRSGSLSLAPSGISNTTASLLHLSSSSNTTFVNLMFKNSSTAADTIISGSNNIFTNPAATTAGFKRYIGGSSNIAMASGSVPQISGSMGFSPTMNNNYFGGANGMIFRGPVSSSAWAINNNLINNTTAYQIGSAAATNAEKIVSGLNMNNNGGSGFIRVQAYKTPLSASFTYSTNIGAGVVDLNLHSSSINMGGCISNGGTTINNSYFPVTSSITNTNGFVAVQSTLFIGGNNIFFSGSNSTVFTQTRQINGSIIIGNNSASLNLLSDSGSLINTAIIGASLGVTGSNSIQLAAAIPSDWGSMFVGRNNAQDNGRAESAKNVFVVGTGTASNKKTGFLIDSGSNIYAEGTFNVSGSTSLTGSLTLNGNTITAVNTASLATTGSNSFVGTQRITGSLIVSGSGAEVRLPSFDATSGRIKEILSFTGSRFASPISTTIDMENLNATEFGFNQLDSTDSLTGTQFILETNKASTFTELKLNARYTGSSDANIVIRNAAGVRTFTVDADVTSLDGLLVTRGVNNNNTALGANVLQSAVSGGNVAVGNSALFSNTSGTDNVALGDNALYANISGDRNMAIGSNTLDSNTTGTLNVAIGNATLAGLVDGSANIGIGFEALKNQTTGSTNVGIGSQALNQNISGSGNIAFGAKAGYNETGNNNFYINNTEYGSINADRSGSLMWGKMDTTTANQTLQINARTRFTNEVLFTTGSNQQAGTAVLDGANPGTVTVSNSLVTANSIIMLTKQTLTNAHMVAVSSKGAGTFTITSNGNGDADTVGWFIINNS